MFERDGREQIKRVARIRGSEIYVLGDNPSRSTDSRSYGWIPRSKVIARVLHP